MTTNQDRAEWAGKALDTFARETGLTNELEGEKHTVVLDLIADLMHFCDANGISFTDCLRVGETHYREETGSRRTKAQRLAVRLPELTPGDIFTDAEEYAARVKRLQSLISIYNGIALRACEHGLHASRVKLQMPRDSLGLLFGSLFHSLLFGATDRYVGDIPLADFRPFGPRLVVDALCIASARAEYEPSVSELSAIVEEMRSLAEGDIFDDGASRGRIARFGLELGLVHGSVDKLNAQASRIDLSLADISQWPSELTSHAVVHINEWLSDYGFGEEEFVTGAQFQDAVRLALRYTEDEPAVGARA